MKSRGATTNVLRMTSMPVLVTLALLLLLVASSIAVTVTRAADGVAGTGASPERALVEPKRSSAVVDLLSGL